MNVAPGDTWTEANQRYLLAGLARVRAALEHHAPRGQGQAPPQPPDVGPISPPPALETLCVTFGLSSFERDTLLLCAGVELDAKFGSLCAAAKNDATQPWPTWSLALAVLPDPHWSALGPAAPLRLWRLIEVGAGPTLTGSPLRIDERVLHYLTGVSHLDERLAGLIEPLRSAGDLVPSHRALAKEIASCWSGATRASALPIVQLCGKDPISKRILAVAACDALGLRLHRLSANVIPVAPAELETMRRLWQRDAALTGGALLLDCDDVDPADSARANAVTRLIEQVDGPLIVATRERRRGLPTRVVSFDLRKPTAGEQRLVWQSALGEAAARLDGRLDLLVAQFDLDAPAIQSACAEALGCHDVESLWDACRRQARPRLDDLAQRIDPVAGWDDLVLPEAQL
ncbi:MAG TPA: ATP-binding protein, partial [Albitalea sp.]|nr:ATP-binding protein [Albitalea sp.]